VYPRRPSLIPVKIAALLAALAAGGCGGDSSNSTAAVPTTTTVNGPGFAFSAPAGRELTRTPRSVSVLPEDASSQELESVTRFPLIKPYRPSLWPRASAELDDVAEQLAESLGGELERQPKTVRIHGLRGRQYEIRYEHEGIELRQRLTLLLSRRTEYQLLCRWEAGSAAPEACAGLETSFRISS
jgi:hypothetical protein